MNKDAKLFIEHILECIGLIKRYLKSSTKKDFLGSCQLQDVVMRRIEIIGEAVKNIPKEIKDLYPSIPYLGRGSLE